MISYTEGIDGSFSVSCELCVMCAVSRVMLRGSCDVRKTKQNKKTEWLAAVGKVEILGSSWWATGDPEVCPGW